MPGFETLFVYDVIHQWREMTGKPAVLAIWAGRREVLTPEVVADFQASKQYGLEHVREIAEAASIKLDLPPRRAGAISNGEHSFRSGRGKSGRTAALFREGGGGGTDSARATD